MPTVLIPWRGGCPHRTAALAWITDRYRSLGWGVLTASPPDGPWCKAAAVAAALSCTNDGRLVIADADAWCDSVADAVDALDDHCWAIPHQQVLRLSEKATADLLAGAEPGLTDLDGSPYWGTQGGGIVAVRRETYLDVPLDPRFLGWGGEDHAWGIALHQLAGRPWIGRHNLIHLWHPPQPEAPPVRGPKSRTKIPNEANRALDDRYRHAKASRREMRALVDEAREATWPSVSSSTVPA